MWNCPVCGTENQGRFCGECGKEKLEGQQETIRIKKVEAANFDGGVTVNYKVDSKVLLSENKKNKKKTNPFVLISIYVVIAILISFFSLFGYYMSAKSDFASGKYDEAGKKFENISFFMNSRYMSSKCVYENATNLFSEGLLEEARAEFMRIKDFENSEEMIFECEYNLLLKYKESNEFESAAKLVESIPENRMFGRKDEIEEIKIWCNYSYAKSIMEKEPEKSRKILEEIDADYEDVKNLILECTYQLAKKYEAEGEFDKAKEEFQNCADYKDSKILLSSLQSNILNNAISAFGKKDYSKCKELIEMCENLSEEEQEKANAYKLFLSYKTDLYQRPAVNNRLFSYLGSYTEARKIVLEDEAAFADFMRGSWHENSEVMFEINSNFEISQVYESRFASGKCKYKSGELFVNSGNGNKRIMYDIEIINNNRIKIHLASDLSEHILTRL